MRSTTPMAVDIPTSDALHKGDLVVPARAQSLVLFVHGSGSSRFSPRNRAVASRLDQAGIATLLFDLLTRREEDLDEAAGSVLCFDIGLLARWLVEVTDWVTVTPALAGLLMGCFGATTRAAAARSRSPIDHAGCAQWSPVAAGQISPGLG
jgi:putative phosphoribosyl transferase